MKQLHRNVNLYVSRHSTGVVRRPWRTSMSDFVVYLIKIDDILLIVF